jgi:putative glutamine amidotransferase
MVPRIGITTFEDPREGTTYHTVNSTYVRSVTAAGGLPILIPNASTGADFDAYAKAYVDILDGILFSGGADLAPHLFGESPLACVRRISESRDSSELALFRAARERKLPTLGICRGCQVINVAMGGTLWQDIPTQVPGAHGHYPEGLPMDELYHYIDIEDAHSRLARALGAGRFLTNSFHHQSVKEPGKGLSVTAKSEDGILEALEAAAPDWFLVAVQFHPEALTVRHPQFLELFKAFVEAASKSAKR